MMRCIHVIHIVCIYFLHKDFILVTIIKRTFIVNFYGV